jgi:hypothetical protein
MKILTPIYILVAAGMMILAGSCENNPGEKNDAAKVSNTLTAGTWRVTYLWESGDNDTENFSGYNFTFQTGGNVIAVNGGTSETGSWTAVDHNDNDNCNLTISFESQNFFGKLSHDWHVIERTSVKVRMVDESGSGGPEYLTLEQN